MFLSEPINKLLNRSGNPNHCLANSCLVSSKILESRKRGMDGVLRHMIFLIKRIPPILIGSPCKMRRHTFHTWGQVTEGRFTGPPWSCSWHSHGSTVINSDNALEELDRCSQKFRIIYEDRGWNLLLTWRFIRMGGLRE